jgi:hypothetical protein
MIEMSSAGKSPAASPPQAAITNRTAIAITRKRDLVISWSSSLDEPPRANQLVVISRPRAVEVVVVVV